MCVCVDRMILRESGLARYLHTAVLSNGALLVFGGNTHNDTSLSNGAKCFSADFLAYDIGKDQSYAFRQIIGNNHPLLNCFWYDAILMF